MKQFEGDIRIYVACLAAYNNGILHGCWIDAEQDAYAIYDDVLRRTRGASVPSLAVGGSRTPNIS